MQTDKISEIVYKIKELELQLRDEIQEKNKDLYCDIGNFTVFKDKVIQEQKRDVENVFKYLANAPILFILTAPIIWSVLIPAIFLDIFVTIYQAICFPVYKIEKVNRKDYIALDRGKLKYLNIIEKFNCTYCSYFNGLIGYVAEVSSRTEQYWCPIKHAKKINFLHSKYQYFFNYGDSADFRKNARKLRDDLKTDLTHHA